MPSKGRVARLLETLHAWQWVMFWSVLTIFVVALLAGCTAWFLWVKRQPAKDVEVLGQTGDSIAPFTAIATVLTFAAGMAGMLLQRRDMAEEAKARAKDAREREKERTEGEKRQVALTKRQEDLVTAEQATTQALKDNVETMRQQFADFVKAQAGVTSKQEALVNTLLAQQTILTNAFSSSANEQRRTARRLVLKETAKEAREHAELFERVKGDWSKAVRNQAASGFRGIPNAQALGATAGALIEWLENAATAAEKNAVDVAAWIVAHDGAVSEDDHSAAAQAMRERWARERNEAVKRSDGLKVLLARADGLDDLRRLIAQNPKREEF